MPQLKKVSVAAGPAFARREVPPRLGNFGGRIAASLSRRIPPRRRRRDRRVGEKVAALNGGTADLHSCSRREQRQ